LGIEAFVELRMVEAAVARFHFPGDKSRLLHLGVNAGKAVEPGHVMVFDVVLLAVGSDELLCFAEVVSGQAGVQVVLDLQVKATVEPVHPQRTVDVERGCALHGEPLVGVVVVSLAVVALLSEVRQSNLHVEETGSAVREEQVGDALLPRVFIY